MRVAAPEPTTRASSLLSLLRSNTNYRYTWIGQVVSEIGDHFNNIAVFSLAVERTGSGLVVAGIMLSRAISAVLAGPVAGVVLDRMDRKRVMIASDLVRAVLAALFILTVSHPSTWLLYVLSASLMFASPFFTAGRAAILPTLAGREELHSANALTQITQWTTLTLGTLAGAGAVSTLGWPVAFAANSVSFLVSAACISKLRSPTGSFAPQSLGCYRHARKVSRPWGDFLDGLRYIRQTPLLVGLAVINIGWASGGGAAQILFSLFGEVVFKRGAAGIGIIWSFAGIGLLVGGVTAYLYGKRLSYGSYKWVVSICYVIHGGAYVLFSQARQFHWALVWIALSRAGVGVTSVLNFARLLRHTPDEFRGRVVATMDSLTWMTMMISMGLAGLASEYWDARTIGMWSGFLSGSTALVWSWLNISGRLPEPKPASDQTEELEVQLRGA